MSVNRLLASVLAATAKTAEDLAELYVENDARLARGEKVGEVIAEELRRRERELTREDETP